VPIVGSQTGLDRIRGGRVGVLSGRTESAWYEVLEVLLRSLAWPSRWVCTVRAKMLSGSRTESIIREGSPRVGGVRCDGVSLL